MINSAIKLLLISLLFYKKLKEGRNGNGNSCTWDFRRPIYEELQQQSTPPPLPPARYRPDCYHPHAG